MASRNLYEAVMWYEQIKRESTPEGIKERAAARAAEIMPAGRAAELTRELMEGLQLTADPGDLAAPAEPAAEIGPALFDAFISWLDRTPKTARSYKTNLKQFAAWMQYAGVDRPQRRDVIAYRDWLISEHEAIRLDPCSVTGWTWSTDAAGNRQTITCKPNTAAQYIRSVKQFFRWTAAAGLYPDIAANIHGPKLDRSHRKEALDAAEVQAIERSIAEQAAQQIAAAQEAQKDTAGRTERSTEQGKRLQAMYLLAVTAGLRTVEISRANIKDFQTKSGQAWLYIWGKGHSEPDQRKPIAPAVAAAIKDYLRSRSDKHTGASPLFVSTGNRSGGQRIAPTTISKMLKGAMRQAGFDSDRITAHSLRHTAGSAVLQLTGRNIYMTQQYMRHSNPATTELYMHDDTSKEEATIAQRLYDYYHSAGSTDGGTSGGGEPLDRLQQIAGKLTAAQLQQLTNIAAAMA